MTPQEQAVKNAIDAMVFHRSNTLHVHDGSVCTVVAITGLSLTIVIVAWIMLWPKASNAVAARRRMKDFARARVVRS